MMLEWARALKNNSTNVSLIQAGARAETDMFDDHCKLTVSHSTRVHRHFGRRKDTE